MLPAGGQRGAGRLHAVTIIRGVEPGFKPPTTWSLLRRGCGSATRAASPRCLPRCRKEAGTFSACHAPGHARHCYSPECVKEAWHVGRVHGDGKPSSARCGTTGPSARRWSRGHEAATKAPLGGGVRRRSFAVDGPSASLSDQVTPPLQRPPLGLRPSRRGVRRRRLRGPRLRPSHLRRQGAGFVDDLAVGRGEPGLRAAGRLVRTALCPRIQEAAGPKAAAVRLRRREQRPFGGTGRQNSKKRNTRV